ncbi:hypothetical protein EJB05_27916, partial [Eragrostis curvula]
MRQRRWRGSGGPRREAASVARVLRPEAWGGIGGADPAARGVGRGRRHGSCSSSSPATRTPPCSIASSAYSLTWRLLRALVACFLAQRRLLLPGQKVGKRTPPDSKPGAPEPAPRSEAEAAAYQQPQAPPVSTKGDAHPTRPWVGKMGKEVVVCTNHFLVQVAADNIVHCNLSGSRCQTWLQCATAAAPTTTQAGLAQQRLIRIHASQQRQGADPNGLEHAERLAVRAGVGGQDVHDGRDDTESNNPRPRAPRRGEGGQARQADQHGPRIQAAALLVDGSDQPDQLFYDEAIAVIEHPHGHLSGLEAEAEIKEEAKAKR